MISNFILFTFTPVLFLLVNDICCVHVTCVSYIALYPRDHFTCFVDTWQMFLNWLSFGRNRKFFPGFSRFSSSPSPRKFSSENWKTLFHKFIRLLLVQSVEIVLAIFVGFVLLRGYPVLSSWYGSSFHKNLLFKIQLHRHRSVIQHVICRNACRFLAAF